MTKKYLQYSAEFKPGDRSVYYCTTDVLPSVVHLKVSDVFYWRHGRWMVGLVGNKPRFWILRPLSPDIERVDSGTKRQIVRFLDEEKLKPKKRRKRKQWEYRLVNYYDEIELDLYGIDGWELVFALNISVVEISLVFKRPMRKGKKSDSRTK